MRYRKLFILPIVLLIVFIITSIIAFNTTEKLNQGYVFIDEGEEDIVYDGDYFLLVGNLGLEIMTVTLSEATDGVNIKFYDINDQLLQEYVIEINLIGESFDSTIITSINTTEKIEVDSVEEHLLVIKLDSTKDYHLDVRTISNLSDEDIGVVFANLPEQHVNMKSLMESVSFTTLVFTVISFLTILAIMYVKRD